MTSIVQGALISLAEKEILEKMISGNAGANAGLAQTATVTAQEFGGIAAQAPRTTVLTLNRMPLTVRDTQVGGGVKIYTFPKCNLVRLGAVAKSMLITTTSAIASTLNSGVTINMGVGTVTQANGTLATTEQDIVQTTNVTSSTTINVAPAAVTGYGVPSVTLLDFTTTSDIYFNIGVATATDIDADATVAVSGVITINWIAL